MSEKIWFERVWWFERRYGFFMGKVLNEDHVEEVREALEEEVQEYRTECCPHFRYDQ